VRSWLRHRKFVQAQSRWRTESIHRRGFHRVGDITRPDVPCSRDSTVRHKNKRLQMYDMPLTATVSVT
jgi:hypothetical protein